MNDGVFCIWINKKALKSVAFIWEVSKQFKLWSLLLFFYYTRSDHYIKCWNYKLAVVQIVKIITKTKYKLKTEQFESFLFLFAFDYHVGEIIFSIATLVSCFYVIFLLYWFKCSFNFIKKIHCNKLYSCIFFINNCHEQNTCELFSQNVAEKF